MTKTQTSKAPAPSWQAGVAFALAEVWRLHQEDIVVRDVLKHSGITFDDLKKGGADSYDYNAVKEALLSAGEKL